MAGKDIAFSEPVLGLQKCERSFHVVDVVWMFGIAEFVGRDGGLVLGKLWMGT